MPFQFLCPLAYLESLDVNRFALMMRDLGMEIVLLPNCFDIFDIRQKEGKEIDFEYFQQLALGVKEALAECKTS